MGARSGHSSGGFWGEQSPQPWEECLCPHGLPMLSCRMRDHLAGNQLPIAPVPVRLASDSPVTGMVAGGFILGLGRPSLWTVVQAVQGGVLGRDEGRWPDRDGQRSLGQSEDLGNGCWAAGDGIAACAGSLCRYAGGCWGRGSVWPLSRWGSACSAGPACAVRGGQR